jgi:hypothetical protein
MDERRRSMKRRKMKKRLEEGRERTKETKKVTFKKRCENKICIFCELYYDAISIASRGELEGF